MYDKCSEEFSKFDPLGCCYFPTVTMSDENANMCRQNCTGLEYDQCCLIKCHIESSKIYANQTFNMTNFEKSIKNFFIYNPTEVKIWTPVIDKSLKTCQPIGLWNLKNCSNVVDLISIS